MEALVEQVELPQARLLYVHARLKRLADRGGRTYEATAQATLRAFGRASPEAVVVPTQTIQSFVHGGIFHVRHSRSEDGAFSEIVRGIARYRTPDPMYSVVDVDGGFDALRSDVDYTTMWGDSSVFALMERRDVLIVNLDLDDDMRFMTHEPERRAGVPYRRRELFRGMVLSPEVRLVEYDAYVRPRGRDGVDLPPYDRRSVRACLEGSGQLATASMQGCTVSWIPARAAVEAIGAALEADPHALVEGG